MSWRTRLQVLSSQYPFCASCAALSVVLLFISAILWFRSQSLTTLQHKRQTEGEAALATINSAPQLKHELSLTREVLQRITKNLAAEENLADNVNYFYRLEEESKARLDDLNPLNSPAPDTDTIYKRVPFNLRVSGTYSQAVGFIRAIESGPRLANITYFSFRRRAPSSSMVTLELNLDLLGKNSAIP